MEQKKNNSRLIHHFSLIEKVYVAAGFIAFLVLASLALQHRPLSWDLSITNGLQTFSSLETPMRAVSYLGDYPYTTVGMVIFFAAALYYLGHKLEARMLVLSTGVAQLANVIIKLIVARPRPSVDVGVKVLVIENSLSFPSGHVTHYVCLYGFLCFLAYKKIPNPALKFLCMMFPLLLVMLVGISRIYLGAHWSSDVTAAYLSASIWLIFIIRLYDYISANAANSAQNARQ